MTMNFKTVIGVVPGYAPGEGVPVQLQPSLTDAALRVASAWDKAASDPDLGPYIPCVITPGIVIYSKDWGCPAGGEVVCTVSAEVNPVFGPPKNWIRRVTKILIQVKNDLRQSALTVHFPGAIVDMRGGQVKIQRTIWDGIGSMTWTTTNPENEVDFAHEPWDDRG